MENLTYLLIALICGVLGGFGIGVVLGWFYWERYYNLLLEVQDMLKNFKSEGHSDKWLK